MLLHCGCGGWLGLLLSAQVPSLEQKVFWLALKLLVSQKRRRKNPKKGERNNNKNNNLRQLEGEGSGQRVVQSCDSQAAPLPTRAKPSERNTAASPRTGLAASCSRAGSEASGLHRLPQPLHPSSALLSSLVPAACPVGLPISAPACARRSPFSPAMGRSRNGPYSAGAGCPVLGGTGTLLLGLCTCCAELMALAASSIWPCLCCQDS